MNENKLNNFNLLQDVEHTSINKYIPSFTNILLLFLKSDDLLEIAILVILIGYDG